MHAVLNVIQGAHVFLLLNISKWVKSSSGKLHLGLAPGGKYSSKCYNYYDLSNYPQIYIKHNRVFS